MKPPQAVTVSGRELFRDGFAGAMSFRAGPGDALEITRLLLAGETISRPAAQCQVEVIAEAPIQARFAGRPNGALRYEADIAACPFSLDVLDGAVLVLRPAGACDFAAADCRVDPAGLWGPRGETIGPEQVKVLERERGRAEANMRAGFHALLAAAGKDKEAVKKIAGEQAGFSSEREMTCRNYQREDAHGFCATKLTEARALALKAAFDAQDHKETAAKRIPRPRAASGERVHAAPKHNNAAPGPPGAEPVPAFPDASPQ
ncbi:MAG TPA: hypothetical protein VFG05_13900 [Methylocella sp.]|nr:hypothetical protein [Methylocella sp.]